MNEFIEEFDIEPTELHYDLEMSWYDYEEEHKKTRDKGELYDRWFKENKETIKDVIIEVAKRDYKVKII